MILEGNLTAIYSANFIAILLLLVLFICNFWRFQYKTYENKMLIYMIILDIATCLVVVASYVIDGKEGMNYRFFGHLTNSFIFTSNMITAFMWMLLIEAHLRAEPSTRKRYYLHYLCL